MANKQTPVQLLQEILENNHLTDEQKNNLQELFQRVIDLEKNHIELAFMSGDLYYKDYVDGKKMPSKNYYDAIYKGGKQWLSKQQ